MMDHKLLINKTITEVYIYIWPPYLEIDSSSIDVSIGLRVDSQNAIHRFCTMDDNWSPVRIISDLPSSFYPFYEYESRLKKWKTGELKDIIGYEVYSFSDHPDFSKIVGSEITSISYLYIDEQPPFGFQITTVEDCIQTFPSADGSCFQTLHFNKDMISAYRQMGAVKVCSI